MVLIRHRHQFAFTFEVHGWHWITFQHLLFSTLDQRDS